MATSVWPVISSQAEWAYEAIAPATLTVTPGQDLELLVDLRNSGNRAGREIVQVYVEGPDDDPARPVRSLAAFAAVDAEPGESRTCRLTVPARAFMRFDDSSHRWVAQPGPYALWAGRSSRDLRLNARMTLV